MRADIAAGKGSFCKGTTSRQTSPRAPAATFVRVVSATSGSVSSRREEELRGALGDSAS